MEVGGKFIGIDWMNSVDSRESRWKHVGYKEADGKLVDHGKSTWLMETST